jgi:hypothetical protein
VRDNGPWGQDRSCLERLFSFPSAFSGFLFYLENAETRKGNVLESLEGS